MRWECCECGARIERPRQPRICRACGAAALFVESELPRTSTAGASASFARIKDRLSHAVEHVPRAPDG